MKKFNCSLYCVVLSLVFSTVILPITVVQDQLGANIFAGRTLVQISEQYKNTSRGNKRSISLLTGFIVTIDMLKQIDSSVEFVQQANSVASPIQIKLNQNIAHRDMNIKAGINFQYFN